MESGSSSSRIVLDVHEIAQLCFKFPKQSYNAEDYWCNCRPISEYLDPLNYAMYVLIFHKYLISYLVNVSNNNNVLFDELLSVVDNFLWPTTKHTTRNSIHLQ